MGNRSTNKPPHRSKGRRLTVEAQQEQRSRSQFDERLTDFGWVVNPKAKDLGEDFLVEVFDDGRSAGLAFMVQLKSTGDLRALSLASHRDQIAYRLEVKDLQHWEVAAHLVVVVVWDVNRRLGVWMAVQEILKQVEHSSPRWRTQGEVTVRFPKKNGTTDRSLQRLRYVVADHNAPLVQKGKTFHISASFQFPPTTKGRAAAESLRRTLDLGEPTQIDGQFIKELKFPAWWERLYGRMRPRYVDIQSSTSNEDIPVRLELDSGIQVQSIDLVLRRRRSGRRGFVLATGEHAGPVVVTVVAEKEKENATVRMNLQVRHLVEDLFEARHATAFLIALHKASSLRLVHRTSSALILETCLSGEPKGPTLASLEEWKVFLDKLCYIQARIRRFGVIKLPKNGVTGNAARPCERFYSILQGAGRLARRLTVTGKVGIDEAPGLTIARNAAKSGQRVEFGTPPRDGGSLRILNVKVPIGLVSTRHDAGPIFEQIEKAAALGKRVAKFSASVSAVEEYADWLPVPGPADASR